MMNTKKIFFALLPAESTKNAIVNQIKTIRKTSSNSILKPTKIENLHLTLCFIGQADEATINCLIEKAVKIRFPAFEFDIDCTGVFTKARVLWLGQHKTSIELRKLAKSITDISNSCDVLTDNREFSPHITIARKFKDKHLQTSFEPIKWHVENFYLMESVSTPDGVEYNAIHKF